MQLSLASVAALAGFEVVHDGLFNHLGFLTSPLTGVLAPVSAERYLGELAGAAGVGAVIAHPALVDRLPVDMPCAVADNPVEAFFRLHLALAGESTRWSGYRGPTVISEGASVHAAAIVAPNDVWIGPGAHIMAGAIVHERVRVGADSVIHSGAVLGSEGFEVRVIDGVRAVVPHVGGVWIGDRVDVMANTVVCRSLFGGDTRVGDDTKIDNLVHVAHDVQLGCRCRVVACAMLGGSLRVGDDVWIGPNATISNSLTIGDGAMVSLGAVVTRHVPPGVRVSGNFAVEHAKHLEWLRTVR